MYPALCEESWSFHDKNEILFLLNSKKVPIKVSMIAGSYYSETNNLRMVHTTSTIISVNM